MRIILLVATAWLTMVGLAGCGAKEAILKPYKLEIQQGNIVTSKMLLQLRPGMTKSQVRFIMGTPLIVDSFHDNRWDYFYQLRQGGKIVQQRRVILDFDKELLAHVRGDVVPQGTAGADTSDAPIGQSIAKPAKEKSLLEKLQFWKSDQAEATDKPLATEPVLVNPQAEGAETAKPQEATTPSAPTDTAQPEDGASGSMLAVPIPLIPATESPAITQPDVAQPEAAPAAATAPTTTPASPTEDNAAGAVVAEPIDTSPVEAAPAVVPTAEEATPATPAPTPAPKTAKEKALEQKAVEEKAPDSTTQTAPSSKANSNQANEPPSAKQPAETTPATTDDELDPPPGYFERLLEKIGF